MTAKKKVSNNHDGVAVLVGRTFIVCFLFVVKLVFDLVSFVLNCVRLFSLFLFQASFFGALVLLNACRFSFLSQLTTCVCLDLIKIEMYSRGMSFSSKREIMINDDVLIAYPRYFELFHAHKRTVRIRVAPPRMTLLLSTEKVSTTTNRDICLDDRQCSYVRYKLLIFKKIKKISLVSCQELVRRFSNDIFRHAHSVRKLIRCNHLITIVFKSSWAYGMRIKFFNEHSREIFTFLNIYLYPLQSFSFLGDDG